MFIVFLSLPLLVVVAIIIIIVMIMIIAYGDDDIHLENVDKHSTQQT